MDNIEIIYDELKRNQIHIDQRTLAFHINTILDQNKDMYSQIHVSDFEQLYREINITNFGRIIAYLAYVYHIKLIYEIALYLSMLQFFSVRFY